MAVKYLAGNRLTGSNSDRSGFTTTNLLSGSQWLETDTNDIYHWDGSSWDLVAGDTVAQTLTNKTLTSPTVGTSLLMAEDATIIFEGATANANETTLTVVDPTADRVVSLPNATDTLIGKATTDTLTNKTIVHASGGNSITGLVNASIGGSAAIANSKLAGPSIILSDGSNTSNIAHGATATFAATSNQTTVVQSSSTVTIGIATNPTLSGNVSVSGNLTVSGDTVTHNVGAVVIEDSLLSLASTNSANAIDIGWYGKYVASSTNYWAGMFWDAGTGNFYARTAMTSEPSATWSGGSAAGINVGAITAAAITGTTIDATTDFTIGDTVITNGVITDSTGLSVIADVAIGVAIDASYNLRVYDDKNSKTAVWIQNPNTGTSANTELLIGQASGDKVLKLGSSYNYSSADWNNAWVWGDGRDLALKSDSDVVIYAGGTAAANIAMSVDSTGVIGIGRASNADRHMFIEKDFGESDASKYGMVVRPVMAETDGASTNVLTGLEVQPYISGASFSVANTQNWTATVGVRAIVAYPVSDGASAAGTITGVAGFMSRNGSRHGSGGVWTNQYGMYIENLTTATNNYAIWTQGATPSYFGGYVGSGTNPSYQLHVSESRNNDYVTSLNNTHATGLGLRINAGATDKAALDVRAQSGSSLFGVKGNVIDHYIVSNFGSSPETSDTYYINVKGGCSIGIDNEGYIAWRNNAGSATVNVLRLDSNNKLSVDNADFLVTGGNVTVTGNIAADTGSRFKNLADASTRLYIDSYSSARSSYLAFENAGTDKWTFGNDGGNSNRFNFYDDAASSNIMTFLTGGNVGIGTNVPQNQLHVATGDSDNNNFRTGADTPLIVETDGSAAYIQIVADANYEMGLVMGDTSNSNDTASGAYLYDSNSGGLILKSGGSPRMYISTAGNVGIGITDPANLLHVGEDTGGGGTTSSFATAAVIYGTSSTNAGPLYVNDTTGTGTTAGVGGKVVFGGRKTSTAYEIFSSIQGFKENTTSNNYAGGLYFRTTANAGNEAIAMTISSSGNVGIGTTAPSGSDWNSNAKLLHLYQNDANGAMVKLQSSNATAIMAIGNDQFQLGTVTNDPVRVYSNGTERMTIFGDGTVVAVSGSIAAQGTSTPSSGAGVEIHGLGVGSAFHHIYAYDRTNSAADNLILQNPGGSVAVGKTTPREEFDVHGNIAVNNEITFAPESDSDTGIGYINLHGYHGGTTRNRNFWIGDGQGAAVLKVTGSTKRVEVSDVLGIGTEDAKKAFYVIPLNTQDVSTSATTISGGTDFGVLTFVTGETDGGTSPRFADLVIFGFDSVTVVSSHSVRGSPPARTYSVSGQELKLAMASGTFDISVLQIFSPNPTES